MTSTVCKCGQFTKPNSSLCFDCIAEQNQQEKFCKVCDTFISLSRQKKNTGLCDECFADHVDMNSKPEIKLRLFEANLEADEEFNHPGFYVMVLAENLHKAKIAIQGQFNVEYEGVIDVFKDRVRFDEIKGPFPAGRILTSLHY